MEWLTLQHALNTLNNFKFYLYKNTNSTFVRIDQLIWGIAPAVQSLILVEQMDSPFDDNLL